MAYIDIKRTVWERFEVSDEGEIPEFSTVDEIDTFISDNNMYGEFLYDTVCDITVEENGGYSTVEVYDDEGELIFSN